MKERAVTRTPRAALVALCLVVLELTTALHFALVPHGFTAGLSGFEHVHAQAASARRPAERDRRDPSPELIASTAGCATEACPLGFTGPHSVLLGRGDRVAVRLLVPTAPAEPPPPTARAQRAVLLSAPKTSPPV